MPDRFSLVRWRHANTDPPKWETLYVTDRGVLMYDAETDAWKDEDGRRWPASVWCYPSPPGDDALTSEDLRYILDDLEASEPDSMAIPIAARLRRAIEEAER